jgi:hypothetical protein
MLRSCGMSVNNCLIAQISLFIFIFTKRTSELLVKRRDATM